MPDLLGYRAKIGIVVPSTNTTMEPEMHSMAPPGVTFHTARLYLAQSSIRSAEEAQKAAAAFQGALENAIRDVMTAEVDHLMIGVSALSFMGGVAGGERFEESLKKITGVPFTTASAAAATSIASRRRWQRPASAVISASCSRTAVGSRPWRCAAMRSPRCSVVPRPA